MNRQSSSGAGESPYFSRRALLLVATFALGFGLVGALIGFIRTSDATATASVTFGTPEPAVFAEAAPALDGIDLENYVETQVDVIGSLDVARRAATILEQGSYSPFPKEVQAATAAERIPEATEIEIAYSTGAADAAVAGANAVLMGYEDLLRERWADHHSRAIASVRQTLEIAEADTQRLLESVTERLAARDQADGDVGTTDITEEMLAIIAELEGIDEEVVGGTSGEGLNALDVRRNILAIEVDALENILAEQLEGSRVSVDSARLESALMREARLRERLLELEVDSRVEGNGIAFTTPATSAAASSAGPMLAGVAGLVLGACLGLAIVYSRQRDRDIIGSPAEARRLLGIPLLSVVDPGDGHHDAPAGPRDGRHSTSHLLARIRSQALEGEPQVLGLIGDDETRASTTIRLASACADDGLDVLVVDGDLDLRSSKDGLATARGLGDFVADGLPVASVIEERRTSAGSAFHLLGHGDSGVVDVLEAEDLNRALDLVETGYDAVLVTTPLPSFASLIADGDRAISCVAVITHESQVNSANRLLKGIERHQIEPLGFIYAYPASASLPMQPTFRPDHTGSRHP